MDTAREFTNRLHHLLRSERNALAEFILALAEFDRRELWKQLGYPSLFPFLTRELGLSEGLAYFRMKACRLVRDFPEVIEPLRDGRLCVTNVVELSKVITPENRGEVVPRYFHVSKKEAEAITVSILPKPVVPTRTLVTAARPAALALEVTAPAEPKRDAGVGTEVLKLVVAAPAAPEPASAPAPASARPRAEVEPLTVDLARVHLTVPPRLLEKLAAARDALSHANPGATDAEVIEAALDALLAKAAKRKGLSDRPLEKPRSSKGDRIPAHVKRAVWLRDGGRCQYKLAAGEICGSTYQLEYEHRVPRALGGPPTVDNITLHCRPHNLQRARETFGDAFMDEFTGRNRRAWARGPAPSGNPGAP
jgi:hypothetical protein